MNILKEYLVDHNELYLYEEVRYIAYSALKEEYDDLGSSMRHPYEILDEVLEEYLDEITS